MATTTSGITAGTRWSYSSGGIAYGVVYNSHYFVLLFYSQVLGLDPGLAGLAVGIGLVFDAITDPLVGYLSDGTRSRWGRRHPWLYASILPLCATFYLLWHPPAVISGDRLLFAWLVTCNVAMRTALTMFLVSAYAIVAEITSEYDARTRLLTGFMVFFSIITNGMSVLMYAIWLVPTESQADGILNAQGYREAGLYGTAMIFASLMVFCIGLHRLAPRFRRFQPTGRLSPRRFLQQVGDVFRSASARAVMIAGVLYYAGTGTYVALWAYMYGFFWQFTSEQVSLIVMPMAVAALVLPPVMRRWAAGREKKNVAIAGMLSAMLVNVAPVCLRLLGWFPENGSEALFWIMLVAGFFETILFLVFDICWASMIADLTERTELTTGRRNEGVISSTITFTTKCSDALGTLIAGILLSLIAFPTETAVNEVPPEMIVHLGLVYGPVVFLVWLGVLVALSRYRLSRSRHREIVAQLARG